MSLHFLYNVLVRSVEKVLPMTRFFSEKIRRFVEGRTDLFLKLQDKISSRDRTIWLHTASLGEFEQAVPVIREIRRVFPRHKIVVSFFSPSGYEVKKNTPLADVVTYLPLDTTEHAQNFLNLVHPEWALLIKYEFWPNFLRELDKRQISTLLVSGAFRQDQIFFKPYGRWMRSYLRTFEHFFVQNQESEKLLTSIGFENVTVSGDTRFDRVSDQIHQDNRLDFVADFLDGELCIVAGSTWPEDDELLVPFLNSAPKNVKVIIAPHALKPDHISRLQKSLQVPNLLYSEKDGADLSQYRVLILNTIGLLTSIYSYSDIAYVGGAAGKTGLHNILEPSTFGVPIIIGKNYEKFPEAKKLQNLEGLFSVSDPGELTSILKKFIADDNLRRKTGKISKKFIEDHTGATRIIIDYLANDSAGTGE